MSLINDVTTDAFDDVVLKADTPVFVDFHAKWCGPCKAMMPILNDVAAEYEGEVKIVKVDVDEEPELASRFEVRALPTFFLMQGGEIKERPSGSITRGSLSAMFERHIGGAQ